MRVFPISPQAVFLIVRDTARRAGIGHLTPHDARRTCAKLMRQAEVPIEQISAILGHGSTRVTERYLGTQLELRPGLAGTDRIPIPNGKEASS